MPKRRAYARRRTAVVVVVAIVLALLAGGQLVLPAIAARVARSEIGAPGASVEIEAVPAWKLVLGRIDTLHVRTPTIDGGGDALTKLLRRARHVSRGDIVVDALTVQQVQLRQLAAKLDHGRVDASADVSIAALAKLVPGGGTLTPQPPLADGLPRFEAHVSVLGVSTDVPVVVRAAGGHIEAAGDGGIAAVVRINVFENPALRIDRVRGTIAGDRLRLTFAGVLQ